MSKPYKDVEIINHDQKKYVVDYNQLKIYHFDEESDFVRYKTVLRNPDLSNKMYAPSQRFLDMLLKHSKVYDPEIHKFKGGD